MRAHAEAATAGHAQPFHVGDRIRKAREHIGQDRQTFAETVGIHRDTLAKYEETGKARRIALVSIGLASGVRLEWLETGMLPWLEVQGGTQKGPASEETGPTRVVPPTGVEPATFGTNDRRLISFPRGRRDRSTGPKRRAA